MGNEDAIFTEPKYKETNDLNSFLKWDKLGKGSEHTPKLSNLIAVNKLMMRKSIGGQPAARDIICEAIQE